jgi:hypothetical protein
MHNACVHAEVDVFLPAFGMDNTYLNFSYPTLTLKRKQCTYIANYFRISATNHKRTNPYSASYHILEKILPTEAKDDEGKRR